MNIETWVFYNFQYVKVSAMAFMFITLFVFEMQKAHQNTIHSILRNWIPNLSLGLMNYIIVVILFKNTLFEVAHDHTGGLLKTVFPYWLYILFTLLFFDLFSYIYHRTYHRVHFFWKFHSVHHSDQVFETSTALRFHIGEVLISFMAKLFLVYFLGLSFLGLAIYELLFLIFNLWEHSDLSLNSKLDKLMSKIFITPSVHRVHHSMIKQDLDSNFGTIFSFWDRLFKTFNYQPAKNKLKVGLEETVSSLNIWQLLKLPFQFRKH